MSSPALPTLIVDLAARRTERRLAVGLVVLAIAAPAIALRADAGVLAGMLMGLAVAGAFAHAGWLGGARSLVQAVGRSDGTWLLIDAYGRGFDATLAAETRMSLYGLWLCWKTQPTADQPTARSLRRRVVMLSPWDTARPDFRRLLVRLRLSVAVKPGVPA